MDDKNYIDVDSIAPSSSNVDINIRQNCVKMSIVLSSILVSQFDFRQIKKKENNGTLIWLNSHFSCKCLQALGSMIANDEERFCLLNWQASEYETAFRQPNAKNRREKN